MAWEAYFVLVVVAGVLLALVRGLASTDWLMMGALTVLTLVGVLTGSSKLPTPQEAVSGLGNPGLVTVGALFVVVAGLAQTGAMSLVTEPWIGQPKTLRSAQMRVLLPVVALSAFLNNTPVVAMFMPVIHDVCRKAAISPSKLFLPLAYAATFGGVCTLIGTSSNLVINGLLVRETGVGLQMFDLTWVGLPCAAAGMLYLLTAGRLLLPDRETAVRVMEDPRQYTVEMLVQPGGPLVGKTIEQAGLRQLPGLFLVEIDRGEELLPAVGPTEKLQGGDRLVFVGVIESVVDLQTMRGLAPTTNQVFKLDSPRSERCLIEAVVSNRCPLIGRSIREGAFRTVYHAAVIGVGRAGRRIDEKIGDIVLQVGDTLLLEAHPEFIQRHRNSVDFFLVSGIENSTPRRHERAGVALVILAGLVVAVTSGMVDMLTAALVAAGLMILLRCCSGVDARRSVDWSLLLIIAASLGVGRAIESSGLAAQIAQGLIELAGDQPWLVLAAVYLVTMLFTEMITNNAAAVLVFPVAQAAAAGLQVNLLPFAIVLALAASSSFSTPIGYQTNLMVFGPGGYRFIDYLRVGLPLNLLFMLITVGLTPWIFPFTIPS